MLRSELSLHLQSKSAEHLDLARARIDSQDALLAELQATVGELQAQMARSASQSEERTAALALRVRVLEQERFKAARLVPGTIRKLADGTLRGGGGGGGGAAAAAAAAGGRDVAEEVALVQVIAIQRISSRYGAGSGARYSLTVSDSQHSMKAMLATQLNSLVHDNTIAQHTVIGLQDFLTNNVNGRRIVIILSLKEEAFCQPPEGLIGAPTALPAEREDADQARHSELQRLATEEARRLREQRMATEERPREEPMGARALAALEFMQAHSENPMGVSLAEVQGVLPRATLAETRAVVEELGMMGLVYSTVDEEHFAATA